MIVVSSAGAYTWICLSGLDLPSSSLYSKTFFLVNTSQMTPFKLAEIAYSLYLLRVYFSTHLLQSNVNSFTL